MKIIYIRAAKSRGYIRIGIQVSEEKRDLTVSEDDYRAVGSPLISDFVSDEMLSVLTSSDMRYRARLFALRMLAYADNNQKNLCRKLIAKGIDRDIAESVSAEMVGLGYIDEARQLDRIIRDEVAHRLTGPKKLFPKLMAKGYSRADIEASVDRLTADGVIDFESSKQALFDKHSPKDEIERKKLLYKNGYDVC